MSEKHSSYAIIAESKNREVAVSMRQAGVSILLDLCIRLSWRMSHRLTSVREDAKDKNTLCIVAVKSLDVYATIIAE